MSSDISTLFSFPGTGLDTDSDLVTIQNGDSRYRLNAILSDDGNHNVVTNSLGNELKNHTLPTGTNTVVGYVEDKENSAGIYFLHNSSNNHCIIRYNSSSDTFTNILYEESAILDSNFTTSKQVDAGLIGNEDEQFLVWADGGILKMINVKYAIDGDYSSPITEEEISFYKKPLTGSITADYPSATGDDAKNLTGRIFQFAVRLKYYDKTFSVLSAYSEIPLPLENMASGKLSADFDYNSIRVTVIMDNEPTIVDSYQLLYRIVDIEGGVPGNWYVYDDYDYTSKGTKTLTFKNDKSQGIISSAEAPRPFDYVPDKVNHLGIIDSNRVVTDVGEEGYDNVSPSVTSTWVVNEIPQSDEGVVQSDREENIPVNTPYNLTIPVNSLLDYFIQIGLTRLSGDSFVHFAYTFGLDGIALGAIFKDYFDSQTTVGTLTITDNSTALQIDLTFQYTDSVFDVEHFVLDQSPYFRTLKTGAKYKFGIEYDFNGKRGAVQTNDDFIISTPTLDEIQAESIDYTNYYIDAEIDITGSPIPNGATGFRFVSFGSDVDYYEEYFGYFRISDITDQSNEYTMFLDNQYTVIKRDETVNRFRKAYGDGIDYGMDIAAGDIVKIMGYFSAPPGLIKGAYYDVQLTTDLEYRIEAVSSTEIKISSSAIHAMSSISNIWLMQIIRKKDNFDDVAQEFSPHYDISFHTGTYNLTEYFSDCWKSKQVYVNSNNGGDYGFSFFDGYAWMEKPKISLHYDSYPKGQGSQGRTNAVNEFAKQRGDRRIRWGGVFLDDLGVSFLTRFEGVDYKEMDDRNGEITKIIQIGDTLKVYQERKSNSLYLKTTSSDDPNGSSTFVFSDNVMSDPRQSVPDYGCTHFSSYAKNVRVGYFFDIVNKTVLRDSQGGIRSISDGEHKMHTYFKEKANSILEYGKDLVQIYGVYDDDFDFYTIAFIVPGDTSHSINDCLSFHEPSGRWVTHFPTPVGNSLQFMGRLSGKPIVSFVDGELYLHTANTVRNNFWGEQSHSEVWIHANEAPHANKVFDSIEINSNGCWCLPEEDSIEITKPSVMRSRIVSGKFKLQEGIFRSEFLRNALNGAGAFIRNLLINGKILRGREMTVKLKNSDTTESQLETVTVRSTISK